MGHHSLCLFCLLIVGTLAVPVPEPARVPKVYNALITSSQNLEPSKAFPVYQPVLHDPFAYPYQPTLFYGGDFPGGNSLIPQSPGLVPRVAPPAQSVPSKDQAESSTETKVSSTDAPVPAAAPEDSSSAPVPPEELPVDDKSGPSTPVPPPPNTQSPIPLNEFGLPPQVLPLGRFDPAFNGYSQVGPLTYSYPGLRFYDPYDPFSWNPYANLPPPLYRSLPNVLNQPTFITSKEILPENTPIQVALEEPQETGEKTSSNEPKSPPPEPSDLNVLNYSSKDPAIPNVPPPPLPEGGLKPDKE